jgi:hypothetical protein
MLHDIGTELQTELRRIGCPVPVLDGPEPMATTSWGRERIVIEHDGSDGFNPARSQRPNPKHRYTRAIGGKFTIYAQSTKRGATRFEHRNRLEHILDLVLCSMDLVAAERKNAWRPTGGAFFTPPDLAETERDGGAAYELSFSFDRGVWVQNWAGDIQPEITMGASGSRVVSITNVRRTHGDDEAEPDVGCGG